MSKKLWTAGLALTGIGAACTSPGQPDASPKNPTAITATTEPGTAVPISDDMRAVLDEAANRIMVAIGADDATYDMEKSNAIESIRKKTKEYTQEQFDSVLKYIKQVERDIWKNGEKSRYVRSLPPVPASEKLQNKDRVDIAYGKLSMALEIAKEIATVPPATRQILDSTRGALIDALDKGGDSPAVTDVQVVRILVPLKNAIKGYSDRQLYAIFTYIDAMDPEVDMEKSMARFKASEAMKLLPERHFGVRAELKNRDGALELLRMAVDEEIKVLGSQQR